MSLKKKILIGGAIGITTLGVVFGGIKLYEYYEAKELVLSYEDVTFPNIYVDGIDVSNLSKAELEKIVREEMEQFEVRPITLTVGEQTYSATLQDFGIVLSHDMNDLTDEIFKTGKDLDILEQAQRITEAPRVEYELTYTYDEKKIQEWVQSIADEVYVEKVNPTFSMTSYGNFEVTEGQEGRSLSVESLIEQINTQLAHVSSDEIAVTAELTIDERDRDPQLLQSVNTKISTYSSQFPVGIPRAKNVELAAAKISKTLLMPGDEFSYTEKVSPVVYSNGYVDATVFVNSQAVDGVGGGICQVSSTLYNTMLLAGIMPTERRNHSLQVGYVPIGLDATMAEDLIDYKFVNTLDYPIYINSYTQNGTLTIEFWSNESALEGVTYQPTTSKIFEDDKTLKYTTTLLGYNANGSLVFNEYIDTSTYKK